MPILGRKLPSWLNIVIVGGAFLTFVYWERRRPLRRSKELKLKHDARNLAVSTLAAATVQLVERPVAEPLTRLVQRRRLGLVKAVSLPAWIEVPLTVLLLDYTLYLWHILTHRVGFLWRFHQAHHVDLDLTATTALRFHFGEFAISVLFRAGQVAAIGASPLALSVWQTLTLVEIMFHHANIELKPEVERWLCRLIVTPRLHGIHHSIVAAETNSNWSSGLTVWDWLHGTLRLDVPQRAITIGVPAYLAPAEVTLEKTLAMPFANQRSSWELPDGRRPSREPEDLAPPGQLAE